MVGRTAAGNLFNLPWCASLTSVCFLPSLSFLPFHPLRSILPDLLLLLLSNFPFRSSSSAHLPSILKLRRSQFLFDFSIDAFTFFIYIRKEAISCFGWGKIVDERKGVSPFSGNFILNSAPFDHGRVEVWRNVSFAFSHNFRNLKRFFFFLWLSILIRVDTTSKYV